MTLGEQRVRSNFNPNHHTIVDEIKGRTAALIDLCESEKPNANSGEAARLWSLAQTTYEEAAMWAVKAATVAS